MSEALHTFMSLNWRLQAMTIGLILIAAYAGYKAFKDSLDSR